MLKVNEIFSSIQGESLSAGYPTTFVRLHGCNMLCTFCDTLYAVTGKKFHRWGVEFIVNTVIKMRNNHVCITGGEPLIQENVWMVIYELCSKGYKVSIETNGGVAIEERKNRSYRYVMDIKCPSSGMDHLNIYENLGKLNQFDEVKFVIGDKDDYAFAKEILAKYPTTAAICMSPLFRGKNSTIMTDLAGWVHNDKLDRTRVGVQLHKILGMA